jgi:uncharacterized repeat protein (TIGR02543 family)
MALIKPFFNTINAFDATQANDSNLVLSILGGDAITSYTYTIYDNDTNLPIVGLENINIAVADDKESESIRTFNISIIANALENNKTYSISAYTSNIYGNSPRSTQSLFVCYLQPTFIVNITTGGATSEISSSTIVRGQYATINPVFDTNDIIGNSPATLNYAQIYVYGNDSFSNEYEVYTSELLYGNDIFETVTGFTPTLQSDLTTPAVDRIYESYSLIVKGMTNDGFEFTSEKVIGFNCYYAILANSPFLTVRNLPNEGLIQIDSILEDYSGILSPTATIFNIDTTYNIGDIVLYENVYYICILESINNLPTDTTYFTTLYILGNEINLTYNNNVTWENYFNIIQPFTYSVWGRKFSDGQEITRLFNNSTNSYCVLKYNIRNNGSGEPEYVYISLEVYRYDYLGNLMFPYYIESDTLLYSEVSDSTYLFVGIQESDSLFDMSLQIVYTIDFVTNSTISIAQALSNNLITLPTPLRTGYTFDGWYLNEEFTGDKIDENLPYALSSNIVLYAKWVEL